MGRFSPTVVADYGPSLGEGLLKAAENYQGARQRKRANERADTESARAGEAHRLNMEQGQQSLAASRAQMEQTRAANLFDATVTRPSIARNAGYAAVPVQASPSAFADALPSISGGGYRFDPQAAPLTPRETFREGLATEARTAATRRDERDTANRFTAGQNEAQRGNAMDIARGGWQNAQAVARIGADSRIEVAKLNDGISISALGRMTRTQKLAHFARVADTALRAVDSQLPPGEQVQYAGKLMARGDAARRLAAELITRDPDTKDYFSFGMSSSDLDAAGQRFGERPAARQDERAVREQQMMARLSGQPLAASTGQAGAPVAWTPGDGQAAAGAAAPAGEFSTHSPDVQKRAASDPEFAKWLRKQKPGGK